MGLDRERLAVGAALPESSVDPNRKQWCCTGALRLSHPRRAGWLLCPGGAVTGEGFLPLAAGNPQRGLSESWPPHSLADGERGPSILKGRLRAALRHPLQGCLGRGRAHHYLGVGLGLGFGPSVLCIRILPFWRRAGWFGQKMLALLCALG